MAKASDMQGENRQSPAVVENSACPNYKGVEMIQIIKKSNVWRFVQPPLEVKKKRGFELGWVGSFIIRPEPKRSEKEVKTKRDSSRGEKKTR